MQPKPMSIDELGDELERAFSNLNSANDALTRAMISEAEATRVRKQLESDAAYKNQVCKDLVKKVRAIKPS